MDNASIADYFSLLSKLMDIYGENSFKSKSYATAAFTIDKLPYPISETDPSKIAGIRGIGASSAEKIIELLNTGDLMVLREWIERTPPGILQMLQIKGLGPKKIATIWKEMEIETIGELLYACQENRLKTYKGFGDKTQQQIMESIEFFQRSQGHHLFAQVEAAIPELLLFFQQLMPNIRIEPAGDFVRELEVIQTIRLVLDCSSVALLQALRQQQEFAIVESTPENCLIRSSSGYQLQMHTPEIEGYGNCLFRLNASDEFYQAFCKQHPAVMTAAYTDEAAVWVAAGCLPVPAYLRESASALTLTEESIQNLIQPADIRGIIHSHSTWSDGSDTLEAMALAARDHNYEYLVISDHSQSAFYANGLKPDRIMTQQQQVDEINLQLAPFKIYKSIESDILSDGSLDYPDEILRSFDLVIASVHSNLKMTEEKAMMRLIKAVENPYTSILGHPTGRLLLSRKGYPVDHRKLIDACAANGVVIELNAHPSRLDIDWRHINYALEKAVLISIDPDAHAISGFSDTRYGVLVARKAGVKPSQNLSSWNRSEFQSFVEKQKAKRP